MTEQTIFGADVPGRTTLERLVEESQAFSAEFDPELANHLPMALVALAELGADDHRLGAFFETYRDASRLKALGPAVAPFTPDDWDRALGDRSREADYRSFFAAEAAAHGLPAVEQRYLPRLVPGIAASALHGLMRLAYAQYRADATEATIALAYWAMSWLPLGQSSGAAGKTEDPAAILAAMRDEPAFGRIQTDAHLLWHWMRLVAEQPEFEGTVDRLTVGPDGLERVARASLALMAGTMTFEALHAVTGSHWMRLVWPILPDPALALRYYWQAVAAVYPKIGCPALPSAEALESMRRLPCPGWPEIKAAAVASDDEHDISLTFSAAAEQKVYGDRLYQVIAAKRVRLIP